MSLLARIYGVFTIKTNVFDPVEVIVMQNTSIIASELSEKMIFDLKGSTNKRLEKFAGKDHNWWLKNQYGYSGVMKDINFLKISKDFNNNLVSLDLQT